MSRYVYTPDMGEISGFGGDYEQACRRMVVAGLEFWDQQDEGFDPHFHGYQGIYGILEEDNDDAKALTQAMLAVCPDASGAMHQATMGHVFAVRKLGWEAYADEMRKPQGEPGDP